MARLELTESELRLVKAALHAYLDDFGHDEADLLRELKLLIARLPEPHEVSASDPDRPSSAVTEL